MKSKEKILVIILRITALMLLTALFAVFLPYDVMAEIHEQIGLGQFPKLPILNYLTRSVSLFYAMHGAILLFISFDVMKYFAFLKFFIYLGVVFGVFMFFIDLLAPMPSNWIYGEGPFIVGLSILFLWFVKSIEKER